MMEKVYSRPSGIFEGAVTGFCPGCMHSSVCKIVTEALYELGMVDNACYVQGVGCCGLAPVCVVNGKTYGRVTVGDVHNIIDEWRKKFDDEDKELAHG